MNKDDTSANAVLDLILSENWPNGLKFTFRALRWNIAQVGLFPSDNYVAELSSYLFHNWWLKFFSRKNRLTLPQFQSDVSHAVAFITGDVNGMIPASPSFLSCLEPGLKGDFHYIDFHYLKLSLWKKLESHLRTSQVAQTSEIFKCKLGIVEYPTVKKI